MKIKYDIHSKMLIKMILDEASYEQEKNQVFNKEKTENNLCSSLSLIKKKSLYVIKITLNSSLKE